MIKRSTYTVHVHYIIVSTVAICNTTEYARLIDGRAVTTTLGHVFAAERCELRGEMAGRAGHHWAGHAAAEGEHGQVE